MSRRRKPPKPAPPADLSPLRAEIRHILETMTWAERKYGPPKEKKPPRTAGWHTDGWLFLQAEIARMRKQGMTYVEIAPLVDRHWMTVWKVWAKHPEYDGLGRPGRKRKFSREEMLVLFRSKVWQTEMARRFGVSKQAISQALRDEGVLP